MCVVRVKRAKKERKSKDRTKRVFGTLCVRALALKSLQRVAKRSGGRVRLEKKRLVFFCRGKQTHQFALQDDS